MVAADPVGRDLKRLALLQRDLGTARVDLVFGEAQSFRREIELIVKASAFDQRRIASRFHIPKDSIDIRVDIAFRIPLRREQRAEAVFEVRRTGVEKPCHGRFTLPGAGARCRRARRRGA